MGLVYVSGESSDFMSALKKNLASSRETINQLKRGSQKIISAVNGKELSGAAYTAGKGLFSELIIPTITRTTDAIEKIEQELQRYKVADQIVAMEGYLDENKLNQQLATTRTMKASVDTTSAFVRSQAQSNPFVGIIETLLNVQRDLNRMSESFQQDIDQIQNKLKKLHDFNSQTSGLFSHSLDELKLAMQGVLVLKNTKVRTDGSYLLPEGTNKKWFIDIQYNSSDTKEVLEQITGWTDYAYNIAEGALRGLKIYGQKQKIRAIKLGSRTVANYTFSRTTRNAKALESVSDDFLDSINVISNNKIWKGIGVAGTVVGAAFEYDNQMKKYNNVGRAVQNTVVHTTIQATGAKIGAAIGTVIPVPILGTMTGAVLGMGVGYLGSKFYDWFESGKAEKVVEEFTITAKNKLKNLKNNIGVTFAFFGKTLGGVFG
ncbi:T7SS effector LXG polymorphic toxin [Enterococcus mundtii]|uniref:T7SS effector LXG polymorphic toxin n=1 Tax=Enterococcus mundtii TaxID=53346 RepID=UPI000CF1AAEF|nr:T7SS effector LXG polymorphic toxin [Enterococcus mundtii]PQC29908.1 hypothetical protein CUM97_09995 [Enterococcus mundtii]